MGDVSKKNFLNKFLLNKVYFQTLQTDIFWTLSWPFSCDYSFWLRDLKFYMCIKDPIDKTCWKNCKDLSNGAPKIKLWNHTKKTHFPVFAKNFAGHGWSWKFFFANFQILGPLGCQGWVVIPQNVKKVKITAPYYRGLPPHHRYIKAWHHHPRVDRALQKNTCIADDHAKKLSEASVSLQ